MTTRSLGLRRPIVPIHLIPEPTYGLDRATTRGGPTRFSAPAPKFDEVDDAAAPVSEFIQPEPEPEPEAVLGIQTYVPPAAKEPPVDPHPGFTDYGGELVPDVGRYTSKNGNRWIDGIPAFLVETDRPVSRIR